MATILEKHTKDGQRYYEIRVSQGRGQTRLSKRWYIPPEGKNWCQKTIDSKVADVAKAFEADVKAGKVHTRAEQKAIAEAEAIAKVEAERKAAEEAAKLKTVKQYAEGVFLKEKEIQLSNNALVNYKQILKNHVFPVLGDVHLINVSPAMVQKLLLDFKASGYSHSSAVKLYNILNGVFQMAFMDDSISVNPMLKVKRPVPRKDEAPKEEADKAYTAKELAVILAYASLEPLKWQAYINLSADTGARRGELCGLQWSDINWEAGNITIRRNLQYTSETGVYVTTTKNKHTRSVDIGLDTLDLLRLLRLDQAEKCISQWVFTQDGTPEPIHPQSPTRYFKKFGERYGIKDFHPHKLRHSSASVAITNGADIVSVSERLGHSDSSVTMKMYAHANEESIRRAGQIVRNALKDQQANNKKVGQG